MATIWSNCIAGWWLGGGGDFRALPFLFGGATLIFFGGALLTQAFTGAFEPQSRAGAPPLGRKTIWILSIALSGAGLLSFIWLGPAAVVLGVALASLLAFSSFLGWQLALSPVVNGLFRILLYLLAASVGFEGVTGWSIWCGFALGCYVAGAGYLEPATPTAKQTWAIPLLGIPVLLALLMDTGPFRESGLLLSALLILWVLRGLRPVLWPGEPGQPASPRELLTGIVLVDWLAACPAISRFGEATQLPRVVSFAFIGFLLLAFLFQNLAREE
ncbi:MAG: hypothetical protein ACREIC_24010 [Limisphaerales bacterium]